MASREAPRKIQAVLWDLDGTLVQSERLHQALEQEVLEDFGLDVSVERLEAFTGTTARAMFEALLAEEGRPELLEEVLARRLELSSARIVDRALPTRGIEAVLRDIPMRTHRFALVTSNDRQIAEGILERFGWDWRFEVLVCAEDVAAPKPAPEPYLRACEGLGLEPTRALAVEDSPRGVTSARAAGCKVAGLLGHYRQADLRGAHFTLSNVGAVPGLLSVLEA